MTKIKIFKHTNFDDLEKDINSWFDQNPSITITDVKQSVTVNKWDSERIVISILYEPKSSYQDMGPG